MSRFVLQIQDESEGPWSFTGMGADDLTTMGSIINAYDPEGTVALRVWDRLLDQSVLTEALDLIRMYENGWENGREAADTVPIIVDWKQDGF
jgi:hypothetical protein